MIAERGSILLRGLVSIFANEADIEVVATLDRGDRVLDTALSIRPEVAVLGVDLPGMDGCAVAAELHQRLPGCRTLIISPHPSTADVRKAVAANVLGFVLSNGPPNGFAEAIRRVAAGKKVIDPDLAFAVLNSSPNPFTPRESEVLRLAAEGSSLNEIARELCLAVGTVRNYLSRIITKTGARNRIDAVRIAEKSGWL